MTQTAKTMIVAVGQAVLLKVDDLRIECVVMDVKNSYGTIRVQISPRSGSGVKWVQMESLVAVAQPNVPAYLGR